MKAIFRDIADDNGHRMPKEIVDIILDSPVGRKAFEKYAGNEFNLRHDIENYLLEKPCPPLRYR